MVQPLIIYCLHLLPFGSLLVENVRQVRHGQVSIVLTRGLLAPLAVPAHFVSLDRITHKPNEPFALCPLHLLQTFPEVAESEQYVFHARVVIVNPMGPVVANLQKVTTVAAKYVGTRAMPKENTENICRGVGLVPEGGPVNGVLADEKVVHENVAGALHKGALDGIWQTVVRRGVNHGCFRSLGIRDEVTPNTVGA